MDAGERLRFDQLLEVVLSQLEPVCLSEQNFCLSFFQLDVLSPSVKVDLVNVSLSTENFTRLCVTQRDCIVS